MTQLAELDETPAVTLPGFPFRMGVKIDAEIDILPTAPFCGFAVSVHAPPNAGGQAVTFPDPNDVTSTIGTSCTFASLKYIQQLPTVANAD